MCRYYQLNLVHAASFLLIRNALNTTSESWVHASCSKMQYNILYWFHQIQFDINNNNKNSKKRVKNKINAEHKKKLHSIALQWIETFDMRCACACAGVCTSGVTCPHLRFIVSIGCSCLIRVLKSFFFFCFQLWFLRSEIYSIW